MCKNTRQQKKRPAGPNGENWSRHHEGSKLKEVLLHFSDNYRIYIKIEANTVSGGGNK